MNKLTATIKKKKELQLTHEIKHPEDREDKIFNSPENGTQKKKILKS